MTMGNWAFIMYYTQDGVNLWTWTLHFAIVSVLVLVCTRVHVFVCVQVPAVSLRSSEVCELHWKEEACGMSTIQSIIKVHI